MKRKVLSLLLTLCMALALLPVTALAEGGLTLDVGTSAEFSEALARTEKVDAINITASLTVTSDCQLKYTTANEDFYGGTVITINSGVTLTIDSGGAIGFNSFGYEESGGSWDSDPQLNGKFVCNGEITVNSGGKIGANFGENNGTITIKDGGIALCRVKNNSTGNITVESGGTLASTMGGAIENGGAVTVNAGARLITWMGGSFKNESGATLTMDGDAIIGGHPDGVDDNGDPFYETLWFENSGNPIASSATRKVFYTYTASGEKINALKSAFGVSEVFYGAPVYTAADLYDAMSGESEVFGRIGVARLMNNIEVEANKELGSMDVELIIPDGVTLTLGENSWLDARIDINNGGEIVVKNGATLSTTQGAPITNDGTITVEAGGTLISQMGSTIENKSNGVIDVQSGGVFNISGAEPESWGMMGQYKDKGGTISGAGTININSSKLHADEINTTTFTGTVNNYTASVETFEELKTALASDKPLVFMTNYDDPGHDHTITITEPVTAQDKTIILLYDDGNLGNIRNISVGTGGSLTLINSSFVRWMEAEEDGEYSVELDLNGGTLTNWTPFPHLTDYSATADITLPTPTRTGYVFNGWKLERFGESDRTISAGDFDITDDDKGYTFTAQWYVPYTPPSDPEPAPETVPVTDGENSVNATADVNNGTAALTVSASNLDKVSGEVAIDLSGLDKPVTAATLSGGSVEKLADKADSLTITLSESEVTLDAAVLSNAAEQAGAGEVSLSVTEYDKTALSEDVQKVIGEQPVYELSLKAGSTELHELGGKATVSLPYTPNEGENPEYVVIWRMVDGVPQPIACQYDAATGLATFETETFSLYVVAYFPFSDVPATEWYYANAAYAYTSGLMQGIGDNIFAPLDEVNRAMLVTTLYRLEGEPAVSSENPFTDVADGQWYTNAVIWAAEKKIVSGYGDGVFGPLDTLSREQMVTILYNYAKYKGYEFAGSADLSAFSDADKVSDWAGAAMQWAVDKGIIQGSGASLTPKDNSNRAQIAAVLERFIKTVK